MLYNILLPSTVMLRTQTLTLFDASTAVYLTEVVPREKNPNVCDFIISTFCELSKIFGSSHDTLAPIFSVARKVGGLSQSSITGASVSLN